MTQRREPIRSKALRRAAAGQRCTINLPNICTYDAETVVLAHIHDETFGRGQKADDTSGAHMCHACHTAYDLHRTGLDEADLLKLVLRAYQRTIRRLVLMGVMQIPQDAPKPFHERKPKARKPREQRTKIQSGRKLESRNDLRSKPERTA